MKRIMEVLVAVAVIVLIGAPGAQADGGTIDKLYVLDCGVGHSSDVSHWTNGIGVGEPVDISVSCYLIHHPTGGYLLSETGVSELVADMPNGWAAGGAQGIRWTMAKKLTAQLAEVGVSPSDIKYVSISHMHPDSYGNVQLFPDSIVLIQRLEFENAFPAEPSGGNLAAPPQQSTPSFRPEHAVKLLQGDTDVFGDGSATLIATPGHTPGHQSLIVHLANTGWVVLTADAVHLQTNWDNRRIPYFARNTMGEGNVAGIQMWLSMQRLADLQSFYKAQLWILHDIEQTKTLKHAPEFYD